METTSSSKVRFIVFLFILVEEVAKGKEKGERDRSRLVKEF